MTLKRILILDGHPAETSLSKSIALAYANAARDAGHDVRLTHLAALNFDPDYGFGGYTNHKPLEPALQDFQQDLVWAQHLVITTPMWWGDMPAKLKGLFDRTLLPGFAFDTRNPLRSGLPAPLLTGRTARVFVTSDTPRLLLRVIYHDAMLRIMRKQVLKFIGFKQIKTNFFAGATHPKPGRIDRWLATATRLGASAH